MEINYFELGKNKADASDHIGAIENYTKAINLKQTVLGSLFFRAKSKTRIGQYESAVRDLEEIIRISPSYEAAYYDLGMLRMRMNKYVEAIEHFNSAIEISKGKNSHAVNNRGMSKMKIGLFEESLSDYNVAIELDSKYSKAYNNRGHLRFHHLKDHVGALGDFMKAIETDPNNAIAYFNRGSFRFTFNLLGALEDFKKVIALDPSFDDAKEMIQHLQANTMMKKGFNSQQLALLANSLAKNLFPKPIANDLLVDKGFDTDDNLSLYFSEDYYNRFSSAIHKAHKDGLFAQSNSESRWLDFMKALDSAEIIYQIPRELKPYIVLGS